MRNPWFHFKQFSIRQDLAAMKVCTDSCIFGAWTAARLGDASRTLDIGTGTGLLTLMLAQEKAGDASAEWHAIELHGPSLEQAFGNFSASPWKDSIRLHAGDVASYSFPLSFDFIIVNPPFYEGQWQSPETGVNQARHENSLTLETLTAVLKKNLSPAGKFAVLLPATRETYFTGLAEKEGFGLLDLCRLKQTPAHAAFRSLMLFGTEEQGKKNENDRSGITELVIRDAAGAETMALLELMKEYYIRPADHILSGRRTDP